MQMPVFLILFFAPVYVPLDVLQGWIHGVASVNPVTYLLETGHGFIAGDAPHIGSAFAIAIGLGLLFWVWPSGPAERRSRRHIGEQRDRDREAVALQGSSRDGYPHLRIPVLRTT